MKKVEVHISSLLSLLNEGKSWLKVEDQGFGSIQEDLNASENEIAIIRKHPKLANVEPNFYRFILIDDVEDKEEVVEVKTTRQRKPKTFEMATEVTQQDTFNVTSESIEEIESFMNI